MKVTIDTNVLVRAVIRDDLAQAVAADKILREAQVLAVTLPALCEFVWVLRNGYKLPRDEIARTIRLLIQSANVITEAKAVEAGLSLLDAGGDFADGVIAFEGAVLGGEVFASFDKGAIERLGKRGIQVHLVA